MKTLLFLSFLAISTFASGQKKVTLPLDQSGYVEFTDVIRLPDSAISKDKLYDKAKLWFANTFTNSKSVIRIDDKENGRLLGKCYEFITTDINNNQTNLTYTIEVLVKNGRFKYRVYDAALEGFNYGPLTDWYKNYINDTENKALLESKNGAKRRYEYLLTQSAGKINPVINSLVSTMQSDSKTDNF